MHIRHPAEKTFSLWSKLKCLISLFFNTVFSWDLHTVNISFAILLYYTISSISTCFDHARDRWWKMWNQSAFLLNDWLLWGFEIFDMAGWLCPKFPVVGGLNTGQTAQLRWLQRLCHGNCVSADAIWSFSCIQPHGIVGVDKWVARVGRKKQGRVLCVEGKEKLKKGWGNSSLFLSVTLPQRDTG